MRKIRAPLMDNEERCCKSSEMFLVNVGQLKLSNPLGVGAGAPGTMNVESLKRILTLDPGFLCLKTVSKRFGGLGIGRRTLTPLDFYGIKHSLFVEGEKSLETLKPEVGLKLLKRAIEIKSAKQYSTCIIPSIMAEPDYEWMKGFLDECSKLHVSALSLNFKNTWKAILKELKLELQCLEELESLYEKIEDLSFELVEKVIDHGFTPIIKLPFEPLVFSIHTFLARKLYKRFDVIIEGWNTSKATPLPSIHEYKPYCFGTKSWNRGVVSGATTFIFHLTGNLELVRQGIPIGNIIHSGGVINFKQALSLLKLGFRAFELCTSLYYQGFGVISKIKSRLEEYMVDNSIKNVEQLTIKNLDSQESYENLVIIRNSKRCTHCGFCNDICPSGINIQLMEVIENCSGCGLCIQNCPQKALTATTYEAYSSIPLSYETHDKKVKILRKLLMGTQTLNPDDVFTKADVENMRSIMGISSEEAWQIIDGLMYGRYGVIEIIQPKLSTNAYRFIKSF